MGVPIADDFLSDDPGDWPEQYYDSEGCIECDYGERVCHCLGVEFSREALQALYPNPPNT